MKIFLSFLLGAAVAVGLIWMFSNPGEVREEVNDAGARIESGARKVGEGIGDAVDRIDGERIEEGLRRTGDAIGDASADALISTKIKANLAQDELVSALRIKVDTTDGIVTLSGRAASQAEAERAVEIARSVDDVKRVMSTIQVVAAPPQ